VDDIQVFDWHRMFMGDITAWFLLEVAFRTGFMFVYTLVLVRTAGKRGLGELSPFELLLVVALGSAVGDPMFYPDVPLLHAMVVIAVIVLLQRVMAVVVDHSRPVERFMESTPTVLVADGVIDLDSLRGERFSRDELFMLLREEGVEQLGQVKRAYLEPSGRISAWLFRREEVAPGLTLMPAEDPDRPGVIPPGEPAGDALLVCASCGAMPEGQGRLAPSQCARCESKDGWVEASEESGNAGDDEGGGPGRRRRRRGPLGG